MSIATKLAKLKTIKQDIKSALEEKGQTPSNVFSTYANNIRAIETGGITPSGEIEITENGTYDVTNYASANVNVASSGGSDLDSFIDGSLTELNSNATSVRSYAFSSYSKLINVNLPNAISIDIRAFEYCSALTSVNIPLLKKIGEYAFNSCLALTSVTFPLLEKIPQYLFRNCSNLTNINIPKATNVGERSFSDCKILESINLSNASYIGGYTFYNCYSLKEILIERTNSVCTLSNINSLYNCYHILGTTNSTYNPNGLKDGYIYVPHTLLTQYKSATNWVQFKSQIIGWGDFASGDTLPNYADYNTYTTCKWYSNKELTQPVYELTMIASGEFVVDSGSANITTAGRYYCKLD